MSDFLVDLASNKTASLIIKKLGLPIPLPTKLKRDFNKTENNILANKKYAMFSINSNILSNLINKTITNSGGNITSYSQDDNFKDEKINGLIFNATNIHSIKQLNHLYVFFNYMIKNLYKNSKIIILCNSFTINQSVQETAFSYALEGFTRSLAKEIGKNANTAQLFCLDENVNYELVSPLRFFLSDKSSYITGRPIRVRKSLLNLNSENWDQPLSNKIALVTGAAQGIGAVTSKLLSKEGAKVICLDRPSEKNKLLQLEKEINGDHFCIDITEDQASQKIFNFIQSKYKSIDIIVHNAGITKDKTLSKMNSETWSSVININLASIININESLIENLMNKNGRVIFLSSIAGIAGNIGQTNYSASKSGVIGLSRYICEKYTTKEITANAVAPGFIETRMTAKMPFLIREIARRMNSLKQGGHPEDVANAIVFLSSPYSQGINNEVLRVCGGTILGA
jgi:3-oxoacyl-[acyl-carrier protein] reductase